MRHTLLIFAALATLACDAAEDTGVFFGRVDALAPAKVSVVPAEPIEQPVAEAVWVLNSFSFLYPAQGQIVDAMDIDSVASRAEQVSSEGACAHSDFTGPNGAANVDHQLLHLTNTF